MSVSKSSCQPSSKSTLWTLCHRWPLPPNAPPFVIVPTTNLYRKFASRTIPTEPQSVVVVEIGCCNGYCTQKIVNSVHSPADQVLGMDVGPQFIRECQDKFPGVQFELTNVLMDWNRVQMLIEEKLKQLKQQKDKTPELHVYVDIGGNREIETLFTLLQTVQTQLKPSSLIVKSKALFAFGQKHDLTTTEAWENLHSVAQAALLKRRQKEESSCETQVEHKDEKGSNGGAQHATGKKKKVYHPLKMPQRYNASGVAICHFHNYDRKNGCLLFRDTNDHGKTCPLDHEHCHACLELEHVAWQCPNQQCYGGQHEGYQHQTAESLVDGFFR
ncbi:unnamed protein product [Cylindrotheca closterium]|uniref:Methyltransferase domain-containing protein n=1 Tax=Cylindrotheca closterium TaxID=2856 RepID=A0AAD2CW37_9STRA|nr:unnamed protein product [Cylindrotheca closterium]